MVAEPSRVAALRALDGLPRFSFGCRSRIQGTQPAAPLNGKEPFTRQPGVVLARRLVRATPRADAHLEDGCPYTLLALPKDLLALRPEAGHCTEPPAGSHSRCTGWIRTRFADGARCGFPKAE